MCVYVFVCVCVWFVCVGVCVRVEVCVRGVDIQTYLYFTKQLQESVSLLDLSTHKEYTVMTQQAR